MHTQVTAFRWSLILAEGTQGPQDYLLNYFRYLAVGGADAIVSLWDLKEWICIRTFDRQEYQPWNLRFC
jgi:hypothetical protein